MRIITKLFLAVVACAAIAFAQTSDTTKQTTTTQQVSKEQGKIVTGALSKNLPKPQTNWTKIKDLFL
jgi:hypothetical protein